MDCGPPPELVNGLIDVSSTLLNSLATYSCNIGYNLNPPLQTVRVCLADGTWFGSDPTCDSKIYILFLGLHAGTELRKIDNCTCIRTLTL